MGFGSALEMEGKGLGLARRGRLWGDWNAAAKRQRKQTGAQGWKADAKATWFCLYVREK